MKRIIFVFVAVLTVWCGRAQSLSEMPKPFCVYGVDFSQVKICGAAESSFEFADAFQRINMLLLSEPEKYNFERFLHSPVATVDIEPVRQNNATGDYATQFNREIKIGEAELQALVNGYELDATEGTGVILVALLLDKTQAKAAYDVIFFDVPTRKLLAVYRMSGKAGGFGLRNYWARSVYEVLKSPIDKKSIGKS